MVLYGCRWTKASRRDCSLGWSFCRLSRAENSGWTRSGVTTGQARFTRLLCYHERSARGIGTTNCSVPLRLHAAAHGSRDSSLQIMMRAYNPDPTQGRNKSRSASIPAEPARVANTYTSPLDTQPPGQIWPRAFLDFLTAGCRSVMRRHRRTLAGMLVQPNVTLAVRFHPGLPPVRNSAGRLEQRCCALSAGPCRRVPLLQC